MNINTGEIINDEKFKELLKNSPKEAEKYRAINIELSEKQIKKHKIGRNDLCGCGSGIKFKKCCLNKKGE